MHRLALVAAVILPLAAPKAPFVTKTVFDDDVRFVFVAGLEGTGHHTIGALFRSAGPDGLVTAEATLMEALFRDGLSLPHGLSVMGEEDKLEASRRAKGTAKGQQAVSEAAGAALRQRQEAFVQELRRVAKAAKGPQLIMLNSYPARETHQSGMISYPNYGGPHNAQHHPDVFDIAWAAEAAGVDLRILVLERSARDILTSITVHRQFADTAYGAAYLADNAAMLTAQLRRIDRRFFLCTEQALMLGTTNTYMERQKLWAKTLAPFLHSSLDVASVITATSRMKKGRAGGRGHDALGLSDPNAGVNAFVDHLDRYVLDLNDTCHAGM